MSRGFLMMLLALDILIMGTSGYMLWNRVHKNILAGSFSSSPVQHPETSPVQKPSSPVLEPSSTPAVETPSKPESMTSGDETKVEAVKPKKNMGVPKKVPFSFRDPGAKKVSVAGDFNRWKPQLMKIDASHRWSITLNLKPGTYAYNFIVDGRRIRDPSRQESRKLPGQKIPASVLVVQSKS